MGPFLQPFLDNEFLQRALLAGVLVSVACAAVGTFVVLRGLAFIGDALAHGVLPGVTLAVLLGLPTMAGAAVGAAVMIAGVSLVTRRSQLSADTAIGLLFVGMLALGVVMVSRSTTFTGDLVRILFGELLGVSGTDVVVQALATAAIVASVAICSRPFLLLCVDAELADVAGFSARRYHVIMLMLVATTVIVAFQTVGTLLVFGMLLAPAGTGALLARRMSSMMLLAALFGSVSVYLGLLASYHYDLAAGATVVLVAVGGFFLVFSVRGVLAALGMARTDPIPSVPAESVPAESVPTESVPTESVPAESVPAAVEAAGLGIGHGHQVLVGDITLHLPAGQVLALVGSNGSGKSTLLKTLVGLVAPQTGVLHVLGQLVSRGHRPPASRVAYLSQFHQDGGALPLRVVDVVRTGRFGGHGLLGRMGPADRVAVQNALGAMAIGHLADASVQALSGGQRQRVYLARALAARGDLLILDEPTAGLDAPGRQLYLDAVAAEQARGVGVIVATHDIGEAAEADQVLLLAQRVVAYGSPEEVLVADHLLETFGIALRSVDRTLLTTEEPHGHDHHTH